MLPAGSFDAHANALRLTAASIDHRGASADGMKQRPPEYTLGIAAPMTSTFCC